MKFELSRRILKIYWIIKFHDKPSSGGGEMCVDRQTANLRTRLKTSQLMLYREIMAVCSEIHTKHINTVCGQNVELLNVKLVVHIVTTGL